MTTSTYRIAATDRRLGGVFRREDRTAEQVDIIRRNLPLTGSGDWDVHVLAREEFSRVHVCEDCGARFWGEYDIDLGRGVLVPFDRDAAACPAGEEVAA